MYTLSQLADNGHVYAEKNQLIKEAAKLLEADPYDITDAYQDGYYIFPLGRFFGMWYEGPCAQKSQPLKQPFITAKPN